LLLLLLRRLLAIGSWLLAVGQASIRALADDAIAVKMSAAANVSLHYCR
jgi:hypothetical protein